MVKLGKQSRSVSIVGVGCTPFTNFEDHPETKGMDEGSAFGYAALEAIQDAGLEPRDIQYFYHGAANPYLIGDSLTPNMQVADWFGVRGIGSVHHSEACCTGYVALQEAVQAVASGTYDIVLSGAVDLAASLPVVNAPGCYRRDFPLNEMLPTIPMVYDRAYGRAFDSAFGISFDNWVNKYRWEYGLTAEQIDDALNGISKVLRREAVANPLGFSQKTFEELAAENNLPDADAYLKSFGNPKVTQYLRVTGFEIKCDGAAAVVVMPTEMAVARGLDHKIVEVLGTGAAAYEGATADNEYNGTVSGTKQVYELTGVKPDEIDLLMAPRRVLEVRHRGPLRLRLRQAHQHQRRPLQLRPRPRCLRRGGHLRGRLADARRGCQPDAQGAPHHLPARLRRRPEHPLPDPAHGRVARSSSRPT